MRKNLLILFFVAAFAWYINQQNSSAADASTVLSIQTASKRYNFSVELAETDRQKREGLMYRESLDRMSGMLFIHPKPRLSSMWMKNTLIPLDMVFIDRHGIIRKIHRNAVPHSEKSIKSDWPVLAVLELNGGITEELNIKKGDKVFYADTFTP